MGSWVFGCDDCQEVCPVNRRPLPGTIAALRAYDDEAAFPLLLPLLTLSEADFRARYRGSAVLRAKRFGLQRNACVALGNLGDPAAVPALAAALGDPDRHPLVREHAAWALGRLATPAARRALERAWTAPPAGGDTHGPGAAPGEALREELRLALEGAP
jgi:epoxyqueuosine reductase